MNETPPIVRKFGIGPGSSARYARRSKRHGADKMTAQAAVRIIQHPFLESPAKAGFFLPIGSDATPRPSLPPFHTDGRCLKAPSGFRDFSSFRPRRGRAQPLAGVTRRV